MKKPKIIMKIIKEDVGYSAYTKLGNISINTFGDTFEELNVMIIEAVNLSFEADGFVYIIEEIGFVYDMASFFAFYNVINAKALSARIGMNQSLLAQYIKGIKKPSSVQTQRILNGVQQIGRELADVRFLL